MASILRTYSQFGQDWDALAICDMLTPGEKERYYVDIGAYDGKTHSNTLLLEEHGWDGICFEPNLDLYTALEKNRPRAVCSPYAVSCDSGQHLFYIPKGMSIVGSCEPYADSNIRKVPCTTLFTALSEWKEKPEYIDFLSMDTERHELKILTKFFAENHEKFVFGFCAIETNSWLDGTGYSTQIKELMERHGYKFFAKNKNDDYYVLEVLASGLPLSFPL